MKFGSPVIYIEGGREYLALVVASRSLKHYHGKNDEPLVNLAFVKQVTDGLGNVRPVSGTVREAELVQFRHDVAHASHEFTAEAKAELSRNGSLPPGGEVPGGRWKEAEYRESPSESLKAAAIASSKRIAEAQAKSDAEAAEKKAAVDAEEKAKADEEAAIEREARIRARVAELTPKEEKKEKPEAPVADGPDSGGTSSIN